PEPGWMPFTGLVSQFFRPAFGKRNPLNIPGPFYGAETDTCEMGTAEAPHNVLLDESGQEFVFTQPSNENELRDILGAAICECFVGYGADFTVKGERIVATAGMFANMPVGTPHSFKNESRDP